MFGVTFYGIFCSGELQPWADPTLEEQKRWNPMDEFGQTKPPVPPPPKTMQSEFIVSTLKLSIIIYDKYHFVTELFKSSRVNLK